MNHADLQLEPATVFWFCADGPLVGRTGELRSHFATLRQALSFVFEDLPPDLQKTSWILVRDGWLAPDQLRRLSGGQRDAPALLIAPDDAEALTRVAQMLRDGLASARMAEPNASGAAA